MGVSTAVAVPISTTLLGAGRPRTQSTWGFLQPLQSRFLQPYWAPADHVRRVPRQQRRGWRDRFGGVVPGKPLEEGRRCNEGRCGDKEVGSGYSTRGGCGSQVGQCIL